MPIRRHDHPGVGHTEPEILKAKNDGQNIQRGESATNRNYQVYSKLKKEPPRKKGEIPPKNVSISMLTSGEGTLVEMPLPDLKPNASSVKAQSKTRKKEIPSVNESMQIILH